MSCKSKKNPAAVALGALGGAATSEAKAEAARENGAKGGRPRGRKKGEPTLVGPAGTRSPCGRRMIDHRGKIVQTPEYVAWTGARHRCGSPASPKYKDYGGRGIQVCERWSSFENFYADMGIKPKWGSLGRIDNDKGYSPDNCRWEYPAQQSVAQRPRDDYGDRARFKNLAHASLTDQVIWMSWAKAAGMSMKDFARRAVAELAERLGVVETPEYLARKDKPPIY